MASTASIQLAKSTLRSEVKQRLKSMTLEDRRRQSKIISDLLINSPEYTSSRRISIYLSMPEEVATYDIMTHIFQTGRHCFIPRYIGSKMEMLRLYSLEDYESLSVTKWNIKQPEEGDRSREDALTSGGLDLIVLPGLGFSLNLQTGSWNRLGRGKGYYDTYLEQFPKLNLPSPLAVGLSFEQQIVQSVPTHAHDRELNCVLHA